jgi:DNA mismatch endonuclease (patch repair protein)
MSDVHSKKTRSYNMSKIRGKNTRPELIVRSYLHRNGLRFRIHDKNLPGKPDIILKKYRTVVFVNGCFWHSHEDCRYSVLPKTRTEWWGNKLGRTKERDRQAIEDLNEIGFKVITIWECMLKKDEKEETLENLVDEILNFNQ